jgi:hypothetical protein
MASNAQEAMDAVYDPENLDGIHTIKVSKRNNRRKNEYAASSFCLPPLLEPSVRLASNPVVFSPAQHANEVLCSFTEYVEANARYAQMSGSK